MDDFGNLSIAALIDQFVRSPLATIRALSDYLAAQSPRPPAPAPDAAHTDAGEQTAPPDSSPSLPPVASEPAAADSGARAWLQAAADGPSPADISSSASIIAHPSPLIASARADRIALAVRILGLILLVMGTWNMAYASIRTEDIALAGSLPPVILGLLCWVAAGVYAGHQEWMEESTQFTAESEQLSAFSFQRAAGSGQPSPEQSESHAGAGYLFLRLRIILASAAFVCSAAAYALSEGNLFRAAGVAAWIASIVLWVWALAPSGWTPLYPFRRWLSRFQPSADSGQDSEPSTQNPLLPAIRLTWVTLVLIALIVVGGVFRLRDLPGVPPEMTSDHVEKLLDSQRVYDGQTQIFFQNNGGREPLQMYVMALLVGVSGAPMDFDTLKLVTALEGILSIPVMFWLGRELFARQDKRLALLVGLALAGLVAVSYWHVALSRLALRIVYTPAIVALILIYLTRAVRDNRRLDWINAGLALGIGLYMYQVVRIMPLVIIVAVALAVILRARTWVERARYGFNLLALVVVAFAVFVPLFRFSVDYPEDFWRRSSGRLFGDQVLESIDEDGNPVPRDPTLGEMITAFNANLPQLTQNLRNAALMYTWKGDIAAINGVSNRPAFDPLSGALLIAGLGAWLGWVIRRRDPAAWLVLPALVILMLPSALAIAMPIENPSATRMSGTLPLVYLLAALALALLLRGLLRALPMRAALLLVGLAFAGTLAFSYAANAQTYFVDYRTLYLQSFKPYSDVGARLRAFALNESSYGNAFMIAYPNWFDHRAIGIEGGRINWPNGIVSRDDIPRFLRDAFLRGDGYRLDPNFPLLFFYAPEDVDTELRLQIWFPEGQGQLIQSYQPEDTYRIFRVPAPGRTGFETFVAEYVPNQ